MGQTVSALLALASVLLLVLSASQAQGAPAPRAPQAASITVEGQEVLTLKSPVGSVTPAERATVINSRLERILSDPKLPPEALAVQPGPRGAVLIVLPPTAVPPQGFTVLEVTQADAQAENSTREQLAQRWARTLRDALTDAKPLHRPPAERHGVSYVPLLLVAALAFLVPVVASHFRRFPVPVVVGEILVGILIGRSGFNLVHYESSLQFLAEFGFAYLMFLSGLEVDFRLLRSAGKADAGSWRRNPLAVAGVTFALTLGVAAVISFALAGAGLLRSPWMMTLVLSTTSLGMVVPTLKERNFTGTPFGQTLLMAALVADFVTMFLITIVAGWVASGPTLRLFLGLLLVGVFVGALRVGRVVTGAPGLQRLVEGLSHTSQVHVRGSLALMLVFVALSEQLGTEVILGAFLAGVLLALFAQRDGSDLRHKLEALGFGFFIPIFFIMVGVRFDLAALTSSREGLILAPVLLVAAFAIKMLASLPFRWLTSWRETLAGGLLLSSRLSLIIAAAEIGLRLGLFSRAVHSAAICVALVTCIVGPLGFQLLMPPLTRRRRRAVIVGTGDYGRVLAGRLRAQAWEVCVVEPDAASLAPLPPGVQAAFGDPTSPSVLEAAKVDEAEILIAATASEELNESVCLEAYRYQVPRLVAVVQKGEVAERLRAHGVTAVTPMLATLQALEGTVTHPAVFNLLTSDEADKRIIAVPLTNQAFVSRPLRQVPWPGDVLVLSIQRDGETLVPDGSTVLRPGDELTFIGGESAVAQAAEAVSGISSGTARYSEPH